MPGEINDLQRQLITVNWKDLGAADEEVCHFDNRADQRIEKFYSGQEERGPVTLYNSGGMFVVKGV